MYSPLPEDQTRGHHDATPVLEFDTVSFSWPGGTGLRNVSFTVPQGQFVLISGPSGAGKSTLLRLVVRLEEIEKGRILLRGTPIDSFYPPELRTRIGFVQQQPMLTPGTVRENLLFPFSLHSRKNCTAPDDETLRRWLNKLALETISLDTPAETLSVGQQQRLCFIRAVLTEPDVICFDEPTSSLDRESRECVEHAAEELAKQGTSILMVNHTSYHPTCPHMHLSVADGIVSVVR